MENLKENKKIKYIWQDNKYSPESVSNINHTNINNNINITNYYPSPSQDYCNKETYTFINDNGGVQNLMSYPIKTATHKTKKIKDQSPTPTPTVKKYHQCQSPYMKKIPASKRQKSEDGNRIINIYKNSPSYKHLKSTKKKDIKNNYYVEANSRKSDTLNSINNKPIITKENNYYLDLSSDEILNKHKNNRNHNRIHFANNNINNINNNSVINKMKYFDNKYNNREALNNNKTVLSYETNGNWNDNESVLNIINPYQLPGKDKSSLYKLSSYEKNNINIHNYNNHQEFVKSQKYMFSNSYYNFKKEISVEKNLNKIITLIQSATRGFLLRLKLAQYLDLYERIKKSVSIIQFIISQRMKYILYLISKNNINKRLSKYYNMYSNITPTNNISIEFKKFKNNKMLKNSELNEMQKELNKKMIDYAVAEKKIKELLIENKKIQNINNIIVRDNKQLALKLKKLENNNTIGYTYNKLQIENNTFNITNNNSMSKNETKFKRNNLLIKITTRKILLIKSILYKYFYKFNYITKLINIDNKSKYFIENNNFIINKAIAKNSNNQNNNEISDIEKRSQILSKIINKKNISQYIYRNIFDKWMMRAWIFKSKDFIKEKKKKKKEKFKQKKQKKLYGYYMDKNDKKNEEENENSWGDSDEYVDKIKSKYRNKSGSGKNY